MKKTLNITIGRRVFAIEEDAYDKLHTYLEAVKKTFSSYPDPEEIISDMEDRLAEQFETMHQANQSQAITLQNVEAVITIMGTPEDIEHETEEEKSYSSSTKPDIYFEKPRRLYRNSDDKIIFGVCSGLAAYFGIDAVWIRIGFILFTFLGGSGIILYLILALIVPEAKTPTEKMEMRGQPITIAGIKDTLKQEFTEEKNKERVEQVKMLAQETTDSVRKVYEDRKPQVESTFKRIIRFPFEILINLIKFIKNKIVPIIVRIAGVFVTLGTLVTIFFLTASLCFVLFNRNSPYIHWPFPELFDPASYHVILFSLFIILFIPCILVFLLGITMVRYKNSFNRAFTISMIGSWIVIGIIGGSTFAAKLPEVLQRAPESPYFKTVIESYTIKDFDRIVFSGNHFKTVVRQGPEFKVLVSGKKPYFKELKIEKIDNRTLSVSETHPELGCLGWCFESYDMTVEVTLPELRELSSKGSRLVTLYPRKEKDVKFIAERYSMIEAADLKADTLNIELKEAGRVRAEGQVTRVNIHSKSHGYFWGEDLITKTATLDLDEDSEIRVNATNQLTLKAKEHTEVYYKNSPKLICEVGSYAIVEPYDKYLEFEESKHDDAYYRNYNQIMKDRYAATKQRCTVSTSTPQE